MNPRLVSRTCTRAARAVTLSASLAALAVGGCAGDGVGITANGELIATATSPDGPATTDYGFRLMGQRVDPTLPSGSTGGVTGSCRVGPSGRELRLESVGGPVNQLQGLRITLNDWSEDACTDCLHGTAQVTVGSLVFSAEDRRAAGASACTLSATRVGSLGMSVTANCAGLAAPGDPRTVALRGTMTVESCDGQDSR